MKSVMRIYIIVIIFVLIMIQPFFLFGQENIRGSVKKPSIYSPIVIGQRNDEDVTFALTPNLTYDIKFSVSDEDGILNPDGGLNEIVVKLWYDENGNDILSERLDVLAFGERRIFDNKSVLDPSNYVEIRWVRGGSARLRGGRNDWKLNLEKSVLPTQENINDTNFEFVFSLTIGKQAREASRKARWQIVAMVNDVDGHEDYRAYKYQAMIGVKMNYYCEVVVDSRMHHFSEFADELKISDVKRHVGGVDYLANYYHDTFYLIDDLLIEQANRAHVLGEVDDIGKFRFGIANVLFDM